MLKELKETVLRIDENAEIYLFGSRARGDFRKNSDWDILVLLEKPLAKSFKKSLLDAILDIELKYEIGISAVLRNKAVWESLGSMPLHINFSKEGKAI